MFLRCWGLKAIRAATKNAASWVCGIFGRALRVPSLAPWASAPPSLFMCDGGSHRPSLTPDSWFDLLGITAHCVFGMARCKRIKDSVIRVNPESCFSSAAVTGRTRCACAILKTRANEINTFYARGRSDKYRAYLPEFPCVVRGFEVSFTPATVSFSSLCRQLVVRRHAPPIGNLQAGAD